MKTFRKIREQIEIPAIGQTLSRDLMPQIDSDFLKYLAKQGISFTREILNTNDLKSTQSEFDDAKILSLMSQDKDTNPIYVSNDNYVLDGHHRWIADHNTDGKTEAYVIDLPILELLRVAKEYQSMLKEDVTHKDFGPMMDSFVSFASDKLGIQSLPKINYKNDDDQGEQPSFGGYRPDTNEIVIQTKNRHPMDVFRTLAHELVHHKQNEDGRIKDVSKEGSTGSPIEDEANSMAGRLMRWFGKSNPDKFSLSHIVEEEQNPLDFDKHFGKTFRITEPEGNSKRQGFSIVTPENGAAWSGPNAWKDRHEHEGTNFIDIARKNFNEPGWLGHKHGQITRSAKQLGIDEANSMAGRLMKIESQYNNKGTLMSDLDEACWKGYYQPKKRKLKPKKGFPGQYVPNCVPKKSVDEEFSQEFKNKPENREWGTKALAKNYAETTPGQTKKKKFVRKKDIEEGNAVSFNSTDEYNTLGTMSTSDGVGDTFGNRYSGITGFGSGIQSSVSSYSYPFGTLAESEAHPVKDDKFDVSNPAHQWVNSRLLAPKGPHVRTTPHAAYENFKEFIVRHSDDPDFGGVRLGIHEFIHHVKDYAGVKMEKAKDGSLYMNAGLHMPPKSISDIKEAWESIGKRDMGTVEKSSSNETVDEDWQKVNRQDKTDGLSQKAVNAYRRENPGSKLKTAVTEKNPSGKRAKRRLSFCKRMTGMKKRLTSAETARDPDSRINKALRRWNCEE